MLGYAILSALLVIAVAGWLDRWFKCRLLTAYLAMKRIPFPTVEELERCAKIVWRQLTRRRK